MTYVIAAYLLDESRKIQLWTCIYSIVEVCNENDLIMLIYHDIDEDYLVHLNDRFKTVIAVKYPHEIDYGIQKISTKTLIQSWYISNIAIENEQLCLLDFDTLVLADTCDVFNDEFDIAYTKKDLQHEKMAPINCGVMYVTKNDGTEIFFGYLAKHVSEINKNPELCAIAERTAGGIGQYVFGNMIKGTTLKLLVLRDTVYNMHHLWQFFTRFTKIVHLKGGLWRRIANGGYNIRGDRAYCRVAKFYLNKILESGYSVLVHSN